ncbi:hypothetical protein SNK03_13571 [Fusarium graminearum]|uniref:Chromosome 1, complete genome n=1 Tax=Gibberella zeae (strain ATCC MYA-4620 / CBS 123657 / FGSC 9075 / NRRL 31084 / PH-1) TaxID=229533 RepID=I1S5P1_GIBZE|nr:hypothetical protein FGSG_12162 [Fusarium graminearum PH-1]ESU08044.1 hypothetical protein FGSG_12162 [Fusarium graminearum PH-1]CEF74910.1 unnamed protein product [Fusarium graminearum]CZS78189.1 unnamed protein product [Fusarium graminearum]|eukprot:XP_011318529.1 hypothetical protein FGSG_12162 [Fusarium graminearum PH-1]
MSRNGPTVKHAYVLKLKGAGCLEETHSEALGHRDSLTFSKFNNVSTAQDKEAREIFVFLAGNRNETEYYVQKGKVLTPTMCCPEIGGWCSRRDQRDLMKGEESNVHEQRQRGTPFTFQIKAGSCLGR